MKIRAHRIVRGGKSRSALAGARGPEQPLSGAGARRGSSTSDNVSGCEGFRRAAANPAGRRKIAHPGIRAFTDLSGGSHPITSCPREQSGPTPRHRGQPVNNDKGQTLNEPLEYGSGVVCEATAPGPVALRHDPDCPRKSSAPVARRLTRSLAVPAAIRARFRAARLNARIRLGDQLRPRQALAPLRTAMWAAYPA